VGEVVVLEGDWPAVASDFARVEFDLPVAKPLADLAAGEIEESELDGLFEFVCPVADEKHDARVGFSDLSEGLHTCRVRRARRRRCFR
jgi:hypothetical protein